MPTPTIMPMPDKRLRSRRIQVADHKADHRGKGKQKTLFQFSVIKIIPYIFVSLFYHKARLVEYGCDPTKKPFRLCGKAGVFHKNNKPSRSKMTISR